MRAQMMGWKRLVGRGEAVSRAGQMAAPAEPWSAPTIGVSLGGGFARGMAHIGVLQVLEEHRIPIDYIAGVSAGAIVAAAYASGASPQEIAKVAVSMRFGDVARWTFAKLGFCCTDRMGGLLSRLLKCSRFEDMKKPVAVVATDLKTGNPVTFGGVGDVGLAVRASCAFPGIFQPIRLEGHTLTDGAISMEVPSEPLRKMGAKRVIAVCIPKEDETAEPTNLVEVIGRSMQIMQMRTEDLWRAQSDLVIAPQVARWSWHDFRHAEQVIEAGADSARKALPLIRQWLEPPTSNLVSLPPAA